jgi:hypothetical protein
MRMTCSTIAAFLLCLPVLHGCSRMPADTPASAAEAPSAAPADAAAAVPPPSVWACDMVTAEEMSAILGAAVHAERNDRSNGKTECIYTPDGGISPYVELSVEWGSGEGAMMGAGMAAQIEPGLTNPYEGLGDQAIAVGPMLMIRTGEDLVSIVFSGVEDAPSKAKRIFDTAKARM